MKNRIFFSTENENITRTKKYIHIYRRQIKKLLSSTLISRIYIISFFFSSLTFSEIIVKQVGGGEDLSVHTTYKQLSIS